MLDFDSILWGGRNRWWGREKLETNFCRFSYLLEVVQSTGLRRGGLEYCEVVALPDQLALLGWNRPHSYNNFFSRSTMILWYTEGISQPRVVAGSAWMVGRTIDGWVASIQKQAFKRSVRGHADPSPCPSSSLNLGLDAQSLRVSMCLRYAQNTLPKPP